ncbi:MAG: hypothetical protein RMJ56_12575 [Gemmataceae bacterium]|nr:protein-disulfide reductase DsbD N-terminal domain-containing protein [Gemmata sp.]MDW8198428.1 hypothetical protein [Gemmataceae bacterium]
MAGRWVTVSLGAIMAMMVAVPTTSAQKWYEKAVKKVEGRFSPAEAVPGQTVTFTLTVELHEGYHTYPLVQPDPAAAGMTNFIRFPAPDKLIFVGEPLDPKDFARKAEPALGIQELRYYTGKVVYTRKAVVAPQAPPGKTTIQLPNFSLSVCDSTTCFPPKKLTVEATLKILDGPAVAVEPAYAEEVRKATSQRSDPR